MHKMRLHWIFTLIYRAIHIAKIYHVNKNSFKDCVSPIA